MTKVLLNNTFQNFQKQILCLKKNDKILEPLSQNCCDFYSVLKGTQNSPGSVRSFENYLENGKRNKKFFTKQYTLELLEVHSLQKEKRNIRYEKNIKKHLPEYR